jgi:hypothetical protein
MRKTIHLKFISWLLLIVITAISIHCVHESAHAMENRVTATGDQAFLTGISSEPPCSCPPAQQRKDFDGCDNCSCSVCHAPLTIQPFQFSYNPTISDLSTFDPFKHLPEVFLSRFIPPQIQA